MKVYCQCINYGPIPIKAFSWVGTWLFLGWHFCVGARQVLLVVRACMEGHHINKASPSCEPSEWLQIMGLDGSGCWLWEGPFLLEPERAWDYCLAPPRDEFRLLYNLFSKLSCVVGRLQLFKVPLAFEGLIPTAAGPARQVGQTCRSCCHKIFSSLSTFVVYLAKGAPPSQQVLTLSDTVDGYCSLAFNYNKSYHNHFLATNPL